MKNRVSENPEEQVRSRGCYEARPCPRTKAYGCPAPHTLLENHHHHLNGHHSYAVQRKLTPQRVVVERIPRHSHVHCVIVNWYFLEWYCPGQVTPLLPNVLAASTFLFSLVTKSWCLA